MIQYTQHLHPKSTTFRRQLCKRSLRASPLFCALLYHFRQALTSNMLQLMGIVSALQSLPALSNKYAIHFAHLNDKGYCTTIYAIHCANTTWHFSSISTLPLHLNETSTEA